MTKKEFIDIMGGIDKKLIESTLDIETPYEEFFTNERPQKVYVPRKNNGALKFSICAAACLAVVVGVTLILKNVNKTPVTPPLTTLDSSDEILVSSDISSDSSSDSETFSESDPITSTTISDPGDMNELYIDREDLRDPTVISSTSSLECKTLFYLREAGEYGSPGLRNIFVRGDGICVLVKSSLTDNDHLFMLDKDGSASGVRHLRFDGSTYDLSKDLRVNDNRVFTASHNFSEFGFNGAKTREMLSDLPDHKSSIQGFDIMTDECLYLYIDPEREKLTLYNMETKTDIASILASDFDLGDSWVIDLVNVVSPELATVTLLNYDPNKASGYTGNENFRTYLVELPTLNIIQQLADDTEIMALDDENFLVAERALSGRRIYRAALENGKLFETGEYFVNCDYNANVLLSPNKKVAVIRENTGAYNMRCTAVYADTLEQIWSIEFSDDFITGFTKPAAVTDDAVLYLSDGIEAQLPVYRISPKDTQ